MGKIGRKGKNWENWIKLEELKKYVQTDSYVEEIAEEKLGLVHNGEIIFKTTK